MQLNQKMMKSLAAIAVIMSVMIMETNGDEKVKFDCCTSVSTKRITVPITGFKYQKENLPCVTAVIFNTTDGEMCVHPRIKWVREKVKELIKLQRQKMNSTVSKPLSTSSP